MEEDASHTERSSVSSSSQTTPQQQQQQPENTEILTPSFTPSSVPSSPTPGSTLSRMGLKSPTSAAPGSPVDRGQVSAITVVALLDKLVNMMEAVQTNQQRMEQRQADLEDAVRVVQGDVTRLSKTHVGTSNSVCKLLEHSRKVSGHLKDVRERLAKQACQVKKLESNHSHLLKRNHFKVLIFQEDNEIPTSVSVKDSLRTPLPSQYDAESNMATASVTGSVDGSHAREGLHTISLSSNEDDDLLVHREENEEYLECEGAFSSSPAYETRADKFKRNSLKKVDSLKKAFSRQSFEKKVNQITTKIVPPERREKIKKSLTPNHPKSPTAKSSSFKVSPMTFNIKKVRDGATPTPDMVSPGEEAHVEITALESLDGESPMAEVHAQEVFSQEVPSPSTPESIKAELEINGEAPSLDGQMNGDHCAVLAVPEDDEGDVEEEEEEEEEKDSPVETAAADAQIPRETIAVEQVS